MCKFFIYIIYNKSSCTKIGGAVARAVLELGRNKEQLKPLNKKNISSHIFCYQQQTKCGAGEWLNCRRFEILLIGPARL